MYLLYIGESPRKTESLPEMSKTVISNTIFRYKQKKDLGGGGSQLWQLSCKQQRSIWFFADLSQDFAIDKSYLRFNLFFFFLVQRGTALKYGDFSIINVLHKRAITTQFSEISFFLFKDWNSPYARESYFGAAYSSCLDMDVLHFACIHLLKDIPISSSF